MLREHEMKEEIKNSENAVEHIKKIETHCVNCKKNTVNKNYSVRRTKQNSLYQIALFWHEKIMVHQKSRSKQLLNNLGIKTT